MQFSTLTLPNRILSYPKIVKGERQAKRLALFAWPNRILSSEKIAKGERRGKGKRTLFS